MTRRITVLSTLGCALATLTLAQAPTTTSTQVPARPPAAMAAPGAPATGFRAEYIAEVDSVGKKLVDLAEAVPADKYAWRPAEGVRSIGEAFMHIVAGTSSIPTFVGGKRLEGITRDSEKTITDKAKIVELLKKGIENAKETGMVVSDADLDKKVKTFGGREMTERQVLMLIVTHMHEHLGQEIAYARMNGIVPPWSKSE
jgi:uncharacterized damage-inducible protein DinB